MKKASYGRKRLKDKKRFARKYERGKNSPPFFSDFKKMMLKISTQEIDLNFGENLVLNLRVRTGL